MESLDPSSSAIKKMSRKCWRTSNLLETSPKLICQYLARFTRRSTKCTLVFGSPRSSFSADMLPPGHRSFLQKALIFYSTTRTEDCMFTRKNSLLKYAASCFDHELHVYFPSRCRYSRKRARVCQNFDKKFGKSHFSPTGRISRTPP